MGELNLEIISPELADIVLDVAEECDQRYCDRMKFKIPPIKIKIVIDDMNLKYLMQKNWKEKKKNVMN